MGREFLSNKRILLIQPPVRDFYFTRKRSMPYGLMCIASALTREGFAVTLLDALATNKSRILEWPESMTYLEPFYGREDLSPFSLFHTYRHFGYSFEHIGNIVKKIEPFLVGVSSLFTAYADEALETARVVKRMLPQSIVVLGGHHPTWMPDAVLDESAVDGVVRGEGEAVMPQLAKALAEGLSLSEIPGVAFRKSNGTRTLKEPVWMDHPDNFPLPGMSLVNHTFYGRKQGNSAVITASRGCPMTCTYCCVASSSSCYRRRSVDSVFAEIEQAVTRFGVRFIDFEDENLTLNTSWCMDLMTRIKDRFGDLGLELRAMNGLYTPSLDDELLTAMKQAGFTALNLSLCTLNPLQLKRFRRADVRESLERVVRCAERLGLETVCYILVGAPGQQAMDSVADLIYLASLPSLAGVSVFYPAPGSAEYDLMATSKTLPESLALYRSTALPVSGSRSRLESVTLLRLGRILNFMKSLKVNTRDLSPRPLDGGVVDMSMDREMIGVMLLRSFFDDAVIRGADASGNVYTHHADESLCRAFRDGVVYS